MSECIDPKFKEMIHAYELDLLTKDDRLQFEQHLLECDSCFEEVRQFFPASILMRHDSEFQVDEESDRAVLQADKDGTETKVGWFNLTRALAIAALIIIFAIPIYWFGFRDTTTPDTTQRLLFTSIRGGTPPILYTDEGGLAELVFTQDTLISSLEYHVTVSSRDGKSVLYENRFFSDFDSLGIGHISLPLSEFEPGFYILSIIAKSENSAMSRQVYNFRVK
jgi:hypothetical protein